MSVVASRKNKTQWKKLLFYIGLVALPTIQFLIFYIYVNFNSILLAFQSYDKITNQYSFAELDNFKAVISHLLATSAGKIQLKNSLILAFFTIVVGLPLSILFAYYVYKGKLFSETFKVVLFMPSIISGLVLIIVYKYMVELGIPEILKKLTGETVLGLYSNPDTKFGTIMFYTLWMGFGSNLLMYLSSMYSINESVVEASKIDGVGFFGEFWFMTIPMTFPTISTFIVTSVAGVFTNQMGLFAFDSFRAPATIQTVGYYMYKELYMNQSTVDAWPFLAAMGLILTIITVPFVFFLRWVFTKYDPMEA